MKARFTLPAAVLACLLSGAPSASADDMTDCAELSGPTALAACNRVVEAHSVRGAELAKILYYRGFEFAQRGETDKAIADFEQSANIDPTSQFVLFALAQGYLAKGDFDRSVSIYSEAIEIDKTDPNAFFYRANAFLQHGDFQKAIDDFSSAISIDPEEADFYNARGVASASAGEHDLAIDDYTSAITRRPDLAVAFLNRGDARLVLDRPDEALEDYRRAAELAPDDAVVTYKLANALRRSGDLDGALAAYTDLIELAPDESDALYESGVTRVMVRDLDGALADLTEAIAIDPDNARAFQARGMVHQARSEMQEAIADYSEAIRLDPDNAERYVMRAWASHLAGRDRLALIDADRAVEINPDLVSPHRTRAAILSALGEAAAAQEATTAADKAKTSAAAAREQAGRDAEAERERRLAARLEQEKSFLKAYDERHPYIYPAELAVTGLGYRYNDDTAVNYDDELSPEARDRLAALQRSKGFRATGHLDEPTFLALLDQPVDPAGFQVQEPWDAPGEAIGDWFFTPGSEWCAIWTKPTAITGRFAPEFGELPLFSINRDRSDTGNSLSQYYADGDLYAEGAKVTVNAGTALETEEFGGDYGPGQSCDDKGCFGSDAVLKAVRAAHSFDVVGESKFGGELVITYSAVGFTKAFNRLDRECGGGRIGVWLK
ncbi:tetratricopeptide repeat protein [Pseudomonas sp. R2.Fl]|nr:tetratricopeptide repeat protein [Pseudomonas sp. R2.Fl]